MSTIETNPRLYVAFLWHMHQPCYKDSLTGKYLMPWVRLHGIKDYFPMASIIENFEKVKVSFNLVPVLVEQINDYVQNDASDIFMDLTVKKASSLALDEKLQILDNFFRVNFKRFIEPNARYSELLIKKGPSCVSAPRLKKAAKGFSSQDLLDLQVLFNLAWFHSISIDDDINLKDLVEKKLCYTEEDKEYILFKQKEILAQILPLYKRLQDSSRIEITTTPYYHPILPLLFNTSLARVSSPNISLPKKRFSHPEDAAWHIEEAIRSHRAWFGQPPRGMWPSEGSVSDETLDLAISKGLDWVATDEDILFKSLSFYDERHKHTKLFDRRLIYRPYRFKRSSRHIEIVFRDKNLSDMISFSYNSWRQEDAALDLLGHLRTIKENLRRDADRGLVTIVMDGENAWEYYEDNGRHFFETLYSNLEKGEELLSTTVSDFLAVEPTRKEISNVFPGSWINHNFDIWIGEEQDNLSWDYLGRVRKDLVKFTKELHRSGRDEPADNIRMAWRHLYIAEGSDWNWWYSGKASSGGNKPFDRLYRTHLKTVYKLLKKPIPDFLKSAIS